MLFGKNNYFSSYETAKGKGFGISPLQLTTRSCANCVNSKEFG